METNFETKIKILNTVKMKKNSTGEVFLKITYGIMMPDRQGNGFNGLTIFETFVKSETLFEQCVKNVTNDVKATLSLKMNRNNNFVPSLMSIN